MKETLISEMQSKGKNISDQTKRYLAQIDQLNEKLNQTKKKTEEVTEKYRALDKENKGLQKVLIIFGVFFFF